MNDLLLPCEAWAERISLAAAGCLSPDDEQETRRHVETCSDCRARFQQLTGLCAELAEARLPAECAEAVIVERVMTAIAAGKPRPLVHTRAEVMHSKGLARSLDTWRWIMSFPVYRLGATAVFLLAATAGALLFRGGDAAYAMHDFIAPILDAKSARFKVATEMIGPPAVTATSDVMVFDAMRTRQETDTGKVKTVMIFDWGQGKALTLEHTTKTATLLTLANMTKAQVAQQDTFAWFRSMLLDARGKPDAEREPLGEKDVDGRRVVGVRVNYKGTMMSLWGDRETGQPVRAEVIMALFPDKKVTLSDFVFNVNLDESLFSVEPPAGYKVLNMNIDASLPQEKDLIDTLREASKLSAGAFPDSLDMQGILQVVLKKSALGKSGQPNDKQLRDVVETQARLQRGSMFAVMLATDAHYAGKGISLGTPDRPIFWYHPKDAKKYRVIYADLTVRGADTPPNLPNAQQVQSPSTPTK
jgi:hypothetical protein